MEIEIRERGDVVIMDISGEVDLYNAPDIKNKITTLIDGGKRNILINLTNVSYIDSSGIGVLISSLSRLKKVGGALKIMGVHGSVKKVFELTKLDKFFEIYQDEEEAIESFK